MINIEAVIAEHASDDLDDLIKAIYNTETHTGEARNYNYAVLGPDVKDSIVTLALIIRGLIEKASDDIEGIKSDADYIAFLKDKLNENDVKKIASLLDSLIAENTDANYSFIQGTCNSTTGAYFEDDNWCTTDFIPIERFYAFHKPLTVGAKIHKYDSQKTHIGSTVYIPDATVDYYRDTITESNVVYLRFDVSQYQGGEPGATAPADIPASGYELLLRKRQMSKYRVDMAMENGALMLDPPGEIGATKGGQYLYRRTQKMLRINGDVEIIIDNNDYTYISGFSVWQYKTVNGEIVYDSIIRVRAQDLIDNKYYYSRQSGIDYLKLVIVPTETATAHKFRPVVFCSDAAIKECYNPAISGQTNGEISFTYEIADGVYTRGVLLLPENYSVDGDKVPLHVQCHGTGGMTYWGSHINIMDESSYEIDTNKMLQYQMAEGFAVFDCYPWTNLYEDNVRQISPFLLDLHERAYVEGIKYVCSRFNVDINAVCVSGLSLGGNLSYWFAHQTEIPIRAVAMLAPTSSWVSPLFKSYFLTQNSRQRIVEILRLSDAEGASDFVSTNNGLDDADVRQFVSDHLFAFAGMSPSNFVNGLTYRQVYDLSLTTRSTLPDWMEDLPEPPEKDGQRVKLATIVDHPECSTLTNCPVKYWQAFDDINVSGYSNYTLFQWMINGGVQAYWRTLSNGHGGHSAIGYLWGDTRYTDQSEKTTRTTRLGTVYGVSDPVPVAMVEMMQFFCDCVGIKFDSD